MKGNNELGLARFLEMSGLKKHCSRDGFRLLSVYHDLGIYGDEAESYIELLEDEFGVDISKFNFDQYFPSEFYEKVPLPRFSFKPFIFLWGSKKNDDRYQRFTIELVEEAIQKGCLH